MTSAGTKSRTGDPRPIVPGYLRAHLLMTENELADITKTLQRFADREGYALGRVFIEHIDRTPAAFGALFDELQRDRPEALVIPSMLHLAPLGLPPKLMHHLQATTGVRVLVANAP